MRTLNRKRGYAGNSAKNRKALQEEYDLLISLSRHKELFENLQAELEQSTEILSGEYTIT